MSSRPLPSAVVVLLLATSLPATLPGQDVEGVEPVEAPQSPAHFDLGSFLLQPHGDIQEILATGGVRWTDPVSGIDVRCDRALIALDRQQAGTSFRLFDDESGLPRRTPELPAPRRSFDEEVLRGRLNSFLGALQRRGISGRPVDVDLEAIRSVFLEGDVSVVHQGVEVLRANSLHFSTVDDRVVLRGVVLRLRDVDSTGQAVQVTVRADRLVRLKGRFVGRDVSVTTCPAGEPQFELLNGEVEIIERANVFEIRTRDTVLAFSGTPILPLPNQQFFSDSGKPFPIRSASAGYSSREGYRANVALGSDLNRLGGSLHETLTGRPADEFRGDWSLGLGWSEERGYPLDAELSYRGGDLYSGQALGFYLDDNGKDIRDIRRNLDGSPIDEDRRRIAWTENRFQVGEHTSLDLTLFHASDAAAWSEFYPERYYDDERPETSVHVRHSQDNWIATGTGRWNLTDFSYADGRQLDTRFVEELPYVTFDLFSQPLADLPGETPLLLTTTTGLGQFRSNYDATIPDPVDDQTWRFDQGVELAAPFFLGPVAVRPFAATGYTHYEHTVDGSSADRWSSSAGIEIGSRMTRTWRWSGEQDSSEALRHVLSPTVRFEHRFLVDVDPAELFQFDEVDQLDEGANIRVGLLQRFVRRTAIVDDSRELREVIWFDLAQNITPISDRDNDGHHLGLGEFEFLYRPQPISDNVSLGIGTEGEQDWNENELRTFNNYIQVLTANVTWTAEYRTDRTDDGQIGYGVSVPVRRRWIVSGRGLYDLEQDQSIRYSTLLIRDDLNWQFILGMNYDVVSDDTSIYFQFEPKFGGLFRRRSSRSRWSAGGPSYAPGQPLVY